MKRSNNKKTKKKQKIKHANISNTRMLLNQVAFTLFSFFFRVITYNNAVKSIYDGYVHTPTDYRVESEVYFSRPLHLLIFLTFFFT